MALRARARSALGLARSLGRTAFAIAAHRSFPTVEGTLLIDGASGRIEIVRDRSGVPHVFATSEADAFFGQGLVHAQDRLFQMDVLRRLAAGRLAEVAGPRAVESDRFMRRLGLTVSAEQDLEAAAPAGRALLEAYARGVNEGVRTLPALPPEFALLQHDEREPEPPLPNPPPRGGRGSEGMGPEPWLPRDALLVGRLIMFGFAGNWDTELLRERLIAALGPRRAAEVEPVHPREGATATGRPHLPAVERMIAAFEAAVSAGIPVGGASNSWAVTGRHTLSGAPLLAADPHLAPRLPAALHVSHIAGGALNAIGADFAGVPGIAIGHNERVAWGITAGMADVSDCFVEDLDPADPRRYRTPEGWATAEERIERIAVRGAAAVEERVLVTRHGPVIGPALPGERRAIALRSTALEPGDLVTPFLALARAHNLEGVEHAIEDWPGTSFNFVIADVDGRVGYRMAGRLPRREVGEGLLPHDGARSPGPAPALPAEDMPGLVDPPSGVVVSANQAPGGALELGEEWCEPRRAERIVGLLASRERHHVASFQAMQVDRYSAHLVRLRDLLLGHGAVAEPEGPLLQRWDGRLEAESAAAAVAALSYNELARALAVRVAGAEARVLLGEGIGGPAAFSSYLYRMQGLVLQATERAASPWFDGIEDRDRQLAGAAARAVERLRRRFGADVRRWRWGALLSYRPDYMLSAVPGIGRWCSRGPFEYGGDVNTVSQAAYALDDAEAPLRVLITAGYRQVIDLGDFDRSTFVLPSGNSGIPGHPHYDDHIEDFLAGRQRPLLFSRAAIEAAAESHLALLPIEGNAIP